MRQPRRHRLVQTHNHERTIKSSSVNTICHVATRASVVSIGLPLTVVRIFVDSNILHKTLNSSSNPFVASRGRILRSQESAKRDCVPRAFSSRTAVARILAQFSGLSAGFKRLHSDDPLPRWKRRIMLKGALLLTNSGSTFRNSLQSLCGAQDRPNDLV